MKRIQKIVVVLSLLLLVALAWPQTALAQRPQPGDELVLGGSYTLSEGETLDSNLIVLGGIATLEQDSRVNGDVVIAGGTLRVRGTINGDIFATGGQISLDDSAVINGEINVVGGNVDRAQGAVVSGPINEGAATPFQFNVPGGVVVPGVRLDPVYQAVVEILWIFVRSFLWAALAVLVVMFLPKQTERSAHTIVQQPLISGGLGLLTVIVFPLLLVIIAITIIGIPVALIAALVLVVAWAFGLVTLGTEVGRRLENMTHQNWALPVSAGLGTFLLTLVINGIDKIPCVGWIAPALAGMLGLGAVLLTRFGTQWYPPQGYVAQPYMAQNAALDRGQTPPPPQPDEPILPSDVEE